MNFKTKRLQPFGVLIEPLEEDTKIQDLDIMKLREKFKEEHLLALRGFKTFENSDDFSNYCENWGEVSLWPFGKVLELIEQEKPKDHIFDNSYVPLHWDGMYRKQVPEIQIFHCVSAPQKNQGGRTTFSHTPMVLSQLEEEQFKSWENVIGVYKRKMEFYDSKTIAPLITKHPERNFSVIRYCELPLENDKSFLNHPNFEFKGIDQPKEFHQRLKKALYNPENFYAHEWQTGDIVISDNYTLLHGRESFISGTPRHLQRVQILGRPALDNPHLADYQ